MNRVELAPGVLSHRCVDCGKWCPGCDHVYYVPARCLPCAAPYVDNPPGADGRVHCRGCDRPFPAELPPGVDKYPLWRKACRVERRSSAAEDRARDATVGVDAVVANAAPRTGSKRGRPPLTPPPAGRTAGRPATSGGPPAPGWTNAA